MPTLLLIQHHPGGTYNLRNAADTNNIPVSQHTSIASKSSAIGLTTAQYAN